MDSSIPIADWLAKLGLSQYAEPFAANKIGFDLLADLTNEDLRELGVSALGDRKRLLAEIATMRVARTEPAPAVSEPQPIPVPVPVPVPAIAPASDVVPASAVTPPELPDASSVGREGPPRSSNASKPPAAARQVAEASAPAPPASNDPPPSRRAFWARLFAGKFLLVSIAAHILFGLGATYYIVQRVQAKRKVTFQGGPPAVTASKRALEHKVSLAKKKNTGGAPPQAKRIVSAGIAKISLPDLPSIPTSTSMPGMKASMGGAGFGTGMGFGQGAGSSMGGGGAGGAGGMTLFGFRGAGGGLTGRFIDLKQTSSRGPTHLKVDMDINAGEKLWLEEVERFLKSGWNTQIWNKYFQSPASLSARQFWVPNVVSELAAESFGVEKEAKGSYWVALYKGRVSPPESGTYHFVGGGDAILLVRVNGVVVLDGSWGDYRQRYKFNDHWHAVGAYDYHYPANIPIPGGFTKGQGVPLIQGSYADMEVLIGDQWGQCNFHLLVEKEGVEYQKTAGGLPILPAFRTGNEKLPPGESPPVQENSPIWLARDVVGWH